MEMENEVKDLEKFESRIKRNDIPATRPQQEDSFLAIIERLASRPDIDPDKIKQFMDMNERILDRNAKQAFNSAMTQAQNKIELVVAKHKNEQTSSRYAKLKDILIEAKPIYTSEGFSLMFYEGETPKENHTRIMVDIMHCEGHTETRWGDFAVQTTGIAGKAMMTLIHGEGSAISYGRRYLTCMIFNIPTGDDDDGNSAGGKIEFVSKGEIAAMQKIITEKNVDQDLFFAYVGTIIKTEIKKLDDIPKAHFKAVMTALKNKKKAPEREPGSDDN
jgi:hypothetical protein